MTNQDSPAIDMVDSDQPPLDMQQVFLLGIMAAAPATEIDDMCLDGADAAKILGLPPGSYNPDLHYVRLVARLRRTWAEAMIAEAASVTGHPVAHMGFGDVR